MMATQRTNLKLGRLTNVLRAGLVAAAGAMGAKMTSTTPAKDAAALLPREPVPFDFGATVNRGRKATRRRLLAQRGKANSGRQWVRLRKGLRIEARMAARNA